MFSQIGYLYKIEENYVVRIPEQYVNNNKKSITLVAKRMSK